MKLLVAFKICPDLELLRDEDIVMTEEMGLDTHFLPNILNCYDESALELSLRLREKMKENALELSAITIGSEKSELMLKGLRALGFVHTIRGKDEKNLTKFRPEVVAETITAYAKKVPQDLILVGKEAPVGNQSVMSQLIAEKVKAPVIGPVIDILHLEERYVEVVISDEGCLKQQKVKLPCVLSVGNAVISKLRVATLRERMKVSKTESEYVTLNYPDVEYMPQPEKVYPVAEKREGYLCFENGTSAIDDVLNHGMREILEQI